MLNNKIAFFGIVLLLLILTTVVHSAFAQNLGVDSSKKQIGTNKAEISTITQPKAKTTIANNTTSQQQRQEINRNLVSNPDFHPDGGFSLFQSNLVNFPANWNDSVNQCVDNYQCTLNFTDGVRDKVSFQVSTTSNNVNRWSWVTGEEINVKPKQQYAVITNMKLNTYSRGSNVVIEGLNQTSAQWYQIAQCPPGTNGPTEWKTYNCQITIPANTNKIKPALNAGWSSQKDREATTLFDHIEIKLTKL
jgi:hypothetical protein